MFFSSENSIQKNCNNQKKKMNKYGQKQNKTTNVMTFF